MPAFVKFEIPKDLEEKVLEAVSVAKASGKMRKGVNETTKAIERGIAKLVVMAKDVTPEELLMHLPALCQEKEVPFTYAPTKIELGKACGIDVPTSSIAITEEGEAKTLIAEITTALSKLMKE